METTYNDVINFINSASVEHCRGIGEQLRHRHSCLQAGAVHQFAFGDKVSFNGKYGAYITGTITKINHKTVKVKSLVDGKIWIVSGSLLTRLPKE